MNTRINYLYRDASNYKLYGSVIIPREITRQQIQEIMKYCLPFDGETRQFIPELVGFPKLEFDCPNEDDHFFVKSVQRIFLLRMKNPLFVFHQRI